MLQVLSPNDNSTTDNPHAMIGESCGRRRKYTVIDAFSGLGGASEAFLRSGDEVHRFDNNPLLRDVPNTQLMDLVATPPHLVCPGVVPDLVWCSPPCTEFSMGYSGPRPRAIRAGRTHFPDLRCLKTSIRLVEYFDPRFWVVENVHGAIRYLTPYLGKPTQIIGQYALWGSFPHIQCDLGSHSKMDSDPWSSDPLRANKRGLVPLALSEALRVSMSTPTLEDF